jgi:ribosome maturation factor RimP
MFMDEIKEKLSYLLAEKFQEPEISHCFLLDISISVRQKVEVFIDSDTGVDFDVCRTVSRFLEAILDENKWLGETYTLEVSSPGVSRPLSLPRQYKKHLGRKLVITLDDDSQFTGIMKETDEEGVLIVWEEKILEGKKKVNTPFEKRCSFSTIKNALVKVSF